ncbi:MAG: Outer membrane protein assembly factor BamD [Chlamydiae bacterium]|nr:Outer membrane protein assembly factor BamD [Chlamydiota bacterium]
MLFGSVVANPLDPMIRSQITVHHHYSAMIDHYQNENWKKLAFKCQDLIADFPESPFAREGLYYLGVAYYKLGEFEYSNQAFSDYLKEELTAKFFEQTIRFKFEIALAFEEGARNHLFGWRRMPKWLPAYDEAIAIYDEVITTMPRNDLAAQSLYRKGKLLLRMEEYKTSVEAFRILIRRFPKHPLSPEGYLGIANVYLTQCEKEFPDSDRLDLAEINLRKFRYHFPGESRLADAEKLLLDMKERLAEDLLEIAEFYERTKKEKAAAIYYATIVKKYPETKVAIKSQKRLERLDVPDIYSRNGQDQDVTLAGSTE